MEKLIILSIILFFSILASVRSYSVSLTLNLNSTQAEWKEAINASGLATLDGTPWIGNVSVKLNGKEVCFVKTNINGFYSCSFFSPSQIGDFSVYAYALSDSTIVGKSNEVVLSVIFFYGGKKPTKDVAAINFPLLIQDLDGKIHRIRAYLKVWG